MKSSIRKIEQAGIGKRLIALIMDGIVTFFLWGCLVTWCTVPIANKVMNYEGNIAKASRYEAFSKLYILKEFTVKEEEREIQPSEFSKIEQDSDVSINPLYNSTVTDVEYYRTRIKYYYCNFKTNKNIEYDPAITDESIKSLYYSPLYNEPIDDGKGNKVLPADYYTETWFEENYGASKITTLEGIKNVAYDAVADLYNSSYFQTINNDIKKAQIFIAIPPYLVAFAIFFVLFPLVFKNGQTLGKKVCKLGFVTKDCFDIKKRQVVFRELLLFAWVSLSLFILGIGLTSLATLGVGVFIYIIATLISKHKRSPIDYAAFLYLIDTGKSVWFKDEAEEEEQEAKLQEKMDKYRNVKVQDKHIIQVGDEIVDEDIKKEIEEQNFKKDKTENN